MKKKQRTRKQKWSPLVPITSIEQLKVLLEDNIIYIDNLKRKNYIRIDTTEMGYEVIDMASPDDVEQMLKSNCYGVYASEVNMSLVYEFNIVMFNKVFSYLIENKRLFYAKD